MPYMRRTTPTPFVRRALQFIRDNPNSYAWEIAEELWPGHPMLTKPAGDRGGGRLGAVVAGGHMGKLRHKGLIYGWSGSYQLTKMGLQLLRK